MTTHKIPASDVVPGMLIGVGLQWEPCTWVGRVNGDRDWIGFQVKGGIAWGVAERKDEMIIRLPGPSPRQLLCTCPHFLEAAVWSRPPHEHDRTCLVALNADPGERPAHGGVLLWPAGAKWSGSIWGWDMAEFSCSVYRLQGMLSGQWDDKPAPGWEQDRALRAFCLPPLIPDLPTELKRFPTPWAAYDDEVYL